MGRLGTQTSFLAGLRSRKVPRKLADAQYIVRREYDGRSWQHLKQRLEANLQDISTSASTPLRDECAKS